MLPVTVRNKVRLFYVSVRQESDKSVAQCSQLKVNVGHWTYTVFYIPQGGLSIFDISLFSFLWWVKRRRRRWNWGWVCELAATVACPPGCKQLDLHWFSTEPAVPVGSQFPFDSDPEVLLCIVLWQLQWRRGRKFRRESERETFGLWPILLCDYVLSPCLDVYI